MTNHHRLKLPKSRQGFARNVQCMEGLKEETAYDLRLRYFNKLLAHFALPFGRSSK